MAMLLSHLGQIACCVYSCEAPFAAQPSRALAPSRSTVASPQGFDSMAASRATFLCLLIALPAAVALQHSGELRAKAPGDALESATDFLLDAQMQVRQMDDLSAEVESLAASVASGGDPARQRFLGVALLLQLVSVCIAGVKAGFGPSCGIEQSVRSVRCPSALRLISLLPCCRPNAKWVSILLVARFIFERRYVSISRR